MLRFNELYIDENNNLVIDVSMNDLDINPVSSGSVGIYSISIGFGSDTDFAIEFSDTDIYNNRYDYFKYDINTSGAITYLRGIIPLYNPAYEYKNQLVCVIVDTNNRLDIPCTLYSSIKGYAYNKCILYNKLFNYIKNSMCTCDNIDNYANYIVHILGLDFAVKSGNFILANKYWNMFFSDIPYTTTSNCNCNG